MDRITVSGEQVINTLRDVARENPDYVYEAPRDMVNYPHDPSCFYVHTSPAGPVCGCIAAHVFHRLGVPLSELGKHEGMSARPVAMIVLDVTGPLAADAVNILQEAQQYQDGEDGNRRTWSDAVASAEISVGLMN